MNERNLKSALFVLVLVCVGMGAALAYLLIQRTPRGTRTGTAEEGDPVVAMGPSAPAGSPHSKPDESSNDSALTPIQLSGDRMQQIGVTTALVEKKSVKDELDVPGSVAMDERRIAYVQTRFAGWVRSVSANATYQYVRKGQRLFTIYSPELVSTEQEYLLARQNQTAASTHMHGTAAQEGDWLLQAAEERLRRFDVSATEINSLVQTGKVQREIAVDSPASGYIIERNALPNAYVQPDTKLYTIADLSSVWVYANVFQTDVGRLKPGDRAQVTVDAYPGRTFNGRIDQILPDVDATTRTVKVRLIFANQGTVLKPGMFVNVKIASSLGEQLVIPASGVLQAGTRQIAYLDRGGGNLEPRVIETGARLDDSIVVTKGLKAGDRIVSSANFLVDSEAQLQASMGGGIPQPAPTGAAQPAQPSAQIEFNSEPDPPRKGANVVRVKLTGADGKPVIGAQVSVTFFMPAMPAMGMAAMHATASLVDRGQGMYEAPLQLGSGGTWEVTVTATRNGQGLATRRMSVSATGGM